MRLSSPDGARSPVQKVSLLLLEPSYLEFTCPWVQMPLGRTDSGELIGKRDSFDSGEEKEDVEGLDLSQEELEQLMTAFRASDTQNNGKILGKQLPAVLAELVSLSDNLVDIGSHSGFGQGIAPSEEDLAILLEEMGASRDTTITFATFAATMARLRE